LPGDRQLPANRPVVEAARLAAPPIFALSSALAQSASSALAILDPESVCQQRVASRLAALRRYLCGYDRVLRRGVSGRQCATAAGFASIYESPRLVDRIFRRDMYERFHRTLQACDPSSGRSVLDVGCGSGQYATALVERGAREVVGLDFAPNMLRIATDNAR